MPATLQKAYPELREGRHSDRRYDEFLCPPPGNPDAESEVSRSTCAYEDASGEPVSSPAARWPAP